MDLEHEKELFDRDILFTEELKERLRQPLGLLFEAVPDESARRASEYLRQKGINRVVAVGDLTAHSLLLNGVACHVVVIDGKVERRPFQTIPLQGFRKLSVWNPAGRITREAALTVFEAVVGEVPTAVVVDGEEDLLVLPAALALPRKGGLLYGQPGRGCVLLEGSDESKHLVRSLLGQARLQRT